MARAGTVPAIIVLALGAGVLGVPDALVLLIDLAGRNPTVDIGICVFFFAIFTVQLLGNLQLVRFVRKAPPAGGAGARRAPTADYFARITLLMSLAAAVLVAGCLGSFSSPLVDFTAKNTIVIVIGGATAAGSFLRAMHPLRAFREQQNARGGAARAERATTIPHAARFIGLPLAAAAAIRPLVDFAAKYYPVVIAAAAGAALPYANARGRAATTRHMARSIGLPLIVAAVCALVVSIPFGVRGGLDALRTSPAGFTSMAVAIVVGAALLLLVGLYPRARNNAASGGGGIAAPAPAAAPRTRGALAR